MSEEKLVTVPHILLVRSISHLSWFLDDLEEIIEAQENGWEADELTEGIKSREKQVEAVNRLLSQLREILDSAEFDQKETDHE